MGFHSLCSIIVGVVVSLASGFELPSELGSRRRPSSLFFARRASCPTLSSRSMKFSSENMKRDYRIVGKWSGLEATRAPTEEDLSSSSSGSSDSIVESVLQSLSESVERAKEWQEEFGLEDSDAAFYALFSAIRSSAPLGLRGQPFVLKRSDVERALQSNDLQFVNFFTDADLANAVDDDFLDASRGSTDNRKGWTVGPVSQPRGQSYDEARMTYRDIEQSLERGTVIFNNIGAHIPKLAGPTLACTDASSLPCAVNMYVTAPDKRTSAPPHTDRQDVILVQTQGHKHWRVYAPPNPALDLAADVFARGKGDDALPLYSLDSSSLLIDQTLSPGDVLFIPAAFPHTTSTNTPTAPAVNSIHLTFNFDTHVWDLDYHSARRLALRRAGVYDNALSSPLYNKDDDDNQRYVGKINAVDYPLLTRLYDALPYHIMNDHQQHNNDESLIITPISNQLEQISMDLDIDTANAVPKSIWYQTIQHIRSQALDLLQIHRDMYISAIEEGRLRSSEAEIMAHLGPAAKRQRTMSSDRMQRLSVFRVQPYTEQIDACKKQLSDWSRSGHVPLSPSSTSSSSTTTSSSLPPNWATTLPLQVGDEVEADLGGAWFSAKVTKVGTGDSYDVLFFDGDKGEDLSRHMIKLLNPPPSADNNDADDLGDTSGLTKKELKKLRKKQEKKNRKK